MGELIINVHHDSPAFAQRIEYVFAFIANHPATGNQVDFRFNEATDTADRQLYYQKAHKPFTSRPKAYFIPAQKVIFNPEQISTKKLIANAYISESSTLYSAELVRQPSQLFTVDRRFQFDWVEMIFFHISRFEEYYCLPSLWDQWDMMKEELQFLVRHGLDKIPVVDHLVYSVLLAMNLEPIRVRTKIRMSHDIDVLEKHTSLYKLGRAWAKLLMNKQGGKAQRSLFASFIKKKLGVKTDPYDSFEYLLGESRQEEKIIYLMAGGLTRYDNLYQLTDPKVKDIIRLARTNNYVIGLHPSYATHANEQQFRFEKDKLEHLVGHEVFHSRQHFLHFSFTSTPAILEQSGILFDSTLGYQNRYGFRCGTGFPYKLFFFEEERAFDFWENPMVFMDVGWLRECSYDSTMAQSSLDLFLQGNADLTQITMNFHNTIFDDTMYDEVTMRKVYGFLAATAQL